MASLINMSGGSLLNKGLPYDAEIEYLGFAKNCSIDTGIYPSTNYKYYWKYLWTNRGNYSYTFSNKNTSRGNWFLFGGMEERYLAQIHIKNLVSINGSVIDANTLYEGSFMRNGNNMEVRLNDTLMVQIAYINFQASTTLTITTNKVNIHGFSIYNENDVLILDLIPVRVGQVGYMYDKVSGQLFGNQGTGAFILGPDK